eukprot:2621634-Rhodomonas_salina.2
MRTGGGDANAIAVFKGCGDRERKNQDVSLDTLSRAPASHTARTPTSRRPSRRSRGIYGSFKRNFWRPSSRSVNDLPKSMPFQSCLYRECVLFVPGAWLSEGCDGTRLRNGRRASGTSTLTTTSVFDPNPLNPKP